MARTFINQDFETDSSPFSTGNPGECTRSTSSPLVGSYSMRMLGDQSSVTSPISPRPSGGANKGLIWRTQFLWKPTVLPTGYAPAIIEARGDGSDGGGTDRHALYINGGATVVTLAVGDVPGLPSSIQDGTTTITATTQYTVRVECRQERQNGISMICWLDGALEAQLTVSTKQIDGFILFAVGGNSLGKGNAADYRWDSFFLEFAQDPK